MGQKFFKRLGVDLSVADENRFESVVAGQFGRIEHKFKVDKRFVVGKSQPDISLDTGLQSELYQFLRLDLSCRWLQRSGSFVALRNLVVLAERTAHIAAQAADRKDVFAWIEVQQRLFLNGIKGEAAEFAVEERDDFPAFSLSGPAKAQGPFAEGAAVRAESAGHGTLGAFYLRRFHAYSSFFTPGTLS